MAVSRSQTGAPGQCQAPPILGVQIAHLPNAPLEFTGLKSPAPPVAARPSPGRGVLPVEVFGFYFAIQRRIATIVHAIFADGIQQEVPSSGGGNAKSAVHRMGGTPPEIPGQRRQGVGISAWPVCSVAGDGRDGHLPGGFGGHHFVENLDRLTMDWEINE